MTVLVAALRDGRWLTAERLRAYPRLLLALYAAVVLVGLASASGPVDPFGRPLGTDFSSVWTAGASALAGRATEPYNPVLTRPLAGVPLGLLAALCLFAAVVRRAVGDRAARPAPA